MGDREPCAAPPDPGDRFAPAASWRWRLRRRCARLAASAFRAAVRGLLSRLRLASYLHEAVDAESRNDDGDDGHDERDDGEDAGPVHRKNGHVRDEA